MPPSLRALLNYADVASSLNVRSAFATLSLLGNIKRNPRTSKSGAITPSGALARRSNRPRTGVLSFSGAISTVHTPASGGAGDFVIYGFGSGATGGGAGTATHNVNSVASLRSAVAASGTRRIHFSAGGTYDLGGSDLNLTNGNVTLDGSDAPTNVILKGGMLQVRANNVIIRGIRFRVGSQVASGGDADAVSLGTYNGSVQHNNVVISHCEMIWGPDVSATILGGLLNCTIQYCIIGEGLYASTHPESFGGPLGDSDGHSLAFNVASKYSSGHNNITLYSNIFTTSQSRQPRFQNCTTTDVINNIFYNYHEGPQGAVNGMNMINNYYKEGPAPGNLGLGTPIRLQFRSQVGGEMSSAPANSVYLSGNLASNFTFATPSGTDATIISGTQKHTPSISGGNLRTAANAYTHVLANAGARLPSIDADTQRLLDNVANGTGFYKSGYRWSNNTFYYPPIDHNW